MPSRANSPVPPERDATPSSVDSDSAAEMNRSHEDQGRGEDGQCLEFVVHGGSLRLRRPLPPRKGSGRSHRGERAAWARRAGYPRLQASGARGGNELPKEGRHVGEDEHEGSKVAS